MIGLEGIVKRFGPQLVLDGVDLGVPEGGVTALIGPSGSGKSTLLRCLNLLEIPDAGRLRLGQDLLAFGGAGRPGRADVLRVRRQTGMVFQNFQLFPHRTVLGNVMEGLVTVRGWGAAAARERALALLDDVGLAHKAESWPATLSGGQQQRVAIARALAPAPRVLLCDEPASALDPELAAEVSAVLRRLAAGGVTMVLATHDLRLASAIARDVVFLEAGRVVEAGPAPAVFGSPRRTRTAAFVGTLGGAG